ncbi:MAG: MraY family glycosyltransferase [Polaribacter sp.]|nr:MraY family glycosyltransferase [Polaribacter sp.]
MNISKNYLSIGKAEISSLLGGELIVDLLVAFFLLFFLTFILIPQIRKAAIRFGLYDTPGDRSSHSSIVPSFGGISFYICYLVLFLFIAPLDIDNMLLYKVASISILFVIGLLDDILDLPAKIKFLGQLLAVSILLSNSEIRIDSLYGFMGIFEIPLHLSVLGSLFFLIGLINAFNLIDGIDGLAALTGIIVACFYSFMLYKLGYWFYLYISIATIAILLAFLRYNFSKHKKLFMGDTGSLVIGLVIGVLTLKLMSVGDSGYHALSFRAQKLPIFLMGVLFVPILDIIRVVLLRFFRGVSIFSPDRNHIHHILIDSGLSHIKATFLIGFANFVVASIMFLVIRIFDTLESMLVLIFIFLISFILLFILNKSQLALRLKSKIKKSFLNIWFF